MANDDQPIAGLFNHSRRNRTLRALAEQEEAIDKRLVAPLAEIIGHPLSIENTHSFASLLVDMDEDAFIAPLIDAISTAARNEASWRADYMYALTRLLGERRNYLHPVEESFVHLLGEWLLNTNGGEISWKAGDILARVQHPATRDYLMRGASDVKLFHLTRIACLGGIMNQYREDGHQVISSIIDDPDSRVRSMAAGALKFLNKQAEER